MHYADIIAALTKKGYTASSVARELEVDPSMVTRVIHGKKNSYNIATYIASVTSVPLRRLWPDGRYSTPPKRVREVQAA